jgi:hypothetical protein
METGVVLATPDPLLQERKSPLRSYVLAEGCVFCAAPDSWERRRWLPQLGSSLPGHGLTAARGWDYPFLSARSTLAHTPRYGDGAMPPRWERCFRREAAMLSARILENFSATPLTIQIVAGAFVRLGA